MDFSELNKVIDENNTFLITAHVNPDADAIGSELALYYALKELKKEVRVINHSETPYNLEFLDEDNIVEKFDHEKHAKVIEQSEVLFALDLNQSNRLVSMEKHFLASSGIKICIDHHPDKGEFADHFLIDTDVSATGQLIYDFIAQSQEIKLNYNMALNIYAAIITDTGAFKYDRTTPRVHYIAADLLEHGVEPSYVFDQIYDQSPIGKIKLLGFALGTMRLNKSSEIAYMTITREMLEKTGALESDVDGFVNYCLAVENVKIGLLFFELKDGIKVSFRSKGKIPINKLAAEFKGGGHLNAAGTRLFNADLNDYQKQIVNAAEKYLGGEN
ncbi:MAG: bifunctional oligoribonuclease/PAP phosphatase NrnA [Melioribacteraceae bacterium]|nr:bifunctional oligoribonuclease/PAP phosphatase NrnA [Melioribacteraceae bacterium]